ncbi:MAG: arginine--tRNA ligase [Dehalococcoidia bacterium]|nr:arginine--tRNA ligase [Dehalococcoidia bacterium]MYD27645.1 arginine--tRNA ligase [Dehalococcoidia bacterium]
MTDTTTLRDRVGALVAGATRAAIEAGTLPDVALPDELVERPRDASHGDYASSLPLRLARSAMMPPLAIAEAIAEHLPANDVIDAPQIAPPGFINLSLAEHFVQGEIDRILEQGAAFADSTLGQGKRVQLEFVSANPTGPLHVGNGRGAAIGDTLASALAAAGYDVEREYYVNDAGTQTDVFAETLYARYQQQHGRDVPLPEGGYPGEYMVDLAIEMREREGDRFLAGPGEPPPAGVREMGIELIVEQIRDTLGTFGTAYDRWFSERSLYEPTADGGPSAYDAALAILRENGHLAQREGALWLTSSNLGEDKDNVVVRSDGRPTYFASDIAYHYDKFLTRGFDQVINVWGADHHGHVSRLEVGTEAVTGKGDALHLLLYQLVTLKRGSETVRLSKRGGEIITLDELIEEVGPDAARFFFLLRAPSSQMDFDLDLAVKQSNENPVFYIQYAHARLASILDRAAGEGHTPDGGDVALLTAPHELALVREMLRLSEVIELVATTYEPQHLAHYGMELATSFHAFNDAFRQQGDPNLKVITDDAALTAARLRLVQAAKIALGRVLDLMGMTAPERM